MNDFPFLLAIPDWVSILIFLVVFVVPVISQIMQNARKNGKKVPRPPQAGGARPRQPGAGGGMKGMEADIDEFLRQAGQQARARPQRREQPAAEPSRPAARQTVGRTQMIDEVIAAQPVPAQGAPRHDDLESGVSRHVREHIESHPVTEHGEELGRQVGASDEKMESHLREVFDHRLGALTDTSSGEDFEHVKEGTDEEVWGGEASRRKREDADVEHRAVEIRNMVRDPVNMRQAIIWSEILRRPDENDW